MSIHLKEKFPLVHNVQVVTCSGRPLLYSYNWKFWVQLSMWRDVMFCGVICAFMLTILCGLQSCFMLKIIDWVLFILILSCRTTYIYMSYCTARVVRWALTVC